MERTLKLANAKLGAVHGFAAVLGGMFEHAPHGAICASLLPHVMRKNCEKLGAAVVSGDVEAAVRLERYLDVAKMVTGKSHATVKDGVEWVEALQDALRKCHDQQASGPVPAYRHYTHTGPILIQALHSYRHYTHTGTIL